MSILHKIDLTFWSKDGHSAFGLTRGQAQILAWVFITAGLLLLDPPFSPIPNDFINIWLAGVLHGWIPALSFNIHLLLTYVFIGPVFFFFGIWVYPYSTSRLLSGYLTKLKGYIKKVLASPIGLIIGIALFVWMIIWYKSRLGV